MATPKLRFKEFDGEWLSAPLKKYFPKIRNGFVGVATPYYVDKGVKYLQGKNVKDGKIDSAGLIYISEEFHLKKNNSKLSIDDILMVQSGHVGECAVIETEYDNANCHALIVLSPHQEQKTNSHFVKYYFYTPLGKKIISQVKTGNTIEHVLASEIKEVELNFPSKEEQTKIASFLSNVDEKINQLTQKHALLSQYKQGMMQKLFSQQIRFKADDGSEFGEWVQKTIGEIGEVITGKTPSTNNPNAWNGDILFVTPTDMNGNKYQTTAIRTVANTHPKILPQNAIMFTCIASIGKMSLSVKPCITNQQINSVVVKKDHPEFIYYQLLNVVNYIKSTQANTTLPIINKTEFSKFILKIPQYTEQTKIANFLSAIDQKIEVVAQQIEQAKQWKKGLLQQMFV